MSKPIISGPQWPPRSPLDALKSTPGGRDRLRRLAERRSPSPSPTKRPVSDLRSRRRTGGANVGNFENDEDDDEDEETLQLQLQEIQARLKLKKFQKSKSKDIAGSDEEIDGRAAALAPSRAGSVAAHRARQTIDQIREHRLERSKSQASIHVPVSPVRKKQTTPEPTRSPGRVLLGIDKGLKAGDVSLRRIPPVRKPEDRLGGYLQRSNSQSAVRSVSTMARPNTVVEERSRTFSERMADLRDREAERKEKDDRIKKSRSNTFDIDEQELEVFKKAAESAPEIQYRPPEFSRDQIMNDVKKPIGGSLHRSKSAAHLSPTKPSSVFYSHDFPAQTRPASKIEPVTSSKTSSTKAPSDPAEFDSFSSLHLSKRIIPHAVLTRTLGGKKTMTIPELFQEVKGPDFGLPDVEEDIVLLAIIAAKSEPRQHKAKATGDGRGKYMVVTLSDLKWELDLFLFDTGFEKFWKLDVGNVIAILNPNIMKPMKADTGRFSVTISSSDDTVLEIGRARDLGFCKSIKKDDSRCNAWIDKRHTEFCEFHMNKALERTKAGRMEVNTMDFGRGAKKKGMFGRGAEGTKQNSFAPQDWETKERKKKEMDQGIRYGPEGKIYVQPSRNMSLLDKFDDESDLSHRGLTKGERMRQRLAEAEKERDIATKLGDIGGGLGADYMRAKHKILPDPSDVLDGPPTPPDAGKLGLLGGKASSMHLSPIKRKWASGTGSQSSAAAIGWGGNLSKELGRMKDGERLQPVRKKTRFVTAKGIREAGRESFGGEVGNPIIDDDDDDLDIV